MPELIVFAGVDAPRALAPWADEDNCEWRGAGGRLADALGALSFSTSWRDNALAAASAAGVPDDAAVLVLFEARAPWTGGERVGSGVCVGRFGYRVDAPSATQVDAARRAADALGDAEAAVRAGIDDWEAGRVGPWAAVGDIGRVANAAAGAFDALAPDARDELHARLAAGQAQARGGLRVVTTAAWRGWLGGATLLALTPTPAGEAPTEPTDTRCALPALDPEGGPGTWVLRGMGHRLIDAAVAGDWRARLDAVRAGWSRAAGWRYVAVVFADRDDAVALAAERLRKPHVYGWYRHGDAFYEPRTPRG